MIAQKNPVQTDDGRQMRLVVMVMSYEKLRNVLHLPAQAQIQRVVDNGDGILIQVLIPTDMVPAGATPEMDLQMKLSIMIMPMRSEGD